MMIFLAAVAREEGFYKPGSRPNRNNNPGDLEFRGWEILYGGKKGNDPRFAVFSSTADGFHALQHLFTFNDYFGKTLEEVFNVYAPPSENETNLYFANVCLWTGLKPSTILTMDLLTLPTA